ncbi:MAG: helix-turn-helix transcriptional regulator [Clostridium sp.]|nr:helix-turn-helix transcriptional regulator [Clostridium sp.]
MEEQDILVERINNLCREKRMTYYALAYASAMPMTTLMHIVDKSTVNPGVLVLERLCKGFGITLGEFFDTPEFTSMS